MDNEISMIEKKLSLKTLNRMKALRRPIFWKPSDDDIRKGVDKIVAQVRLTLRGKLYGFLLNGMLYYPNKARVWAFKRSLNEQYLNNLTEVTLEESSV